MSAGNYIQTIKRMNVLIKKQESEIARLKKELTDQNKKAFDKINVLERTLYWLNGRNVWQRILNKQPVNNIKEAA